MKGALTGKGFDKQVQMLTPRAPVQRDVAPAPDAQAETPSAGRAQTNDLHPEEGAGKPPAAPLDDAAAVTLTVQNEFEDPLGKKTDRTTVGVGENNWISASAPGGTWTSSGGTGKLDQGDYKWTAPGAAASVTVTYTLNSKATTLTINVVAPTGTITGKKTGEVAIAGGKVGSGMKLDLSMNPLTVSFSNLGWLEEQGAISGTGSMQNAQPTIAHNPAWLKMGTNGNNEIADQADMNWSQKVPGTATYEIKEKYRVGTGGSPTQYAVLNQEFEIFDTEGTAQVRKAGESSNKRKP